MNANELQKKIVGILTTEGNVTVSQLAKHLRVRPHSIRYQLDRLVETQSLVKSIMINQRALGYQVFNLFFDLPAARAKKAIEFLSGRDEVAWLAQNVGPRRYEMTIVIRDYTALAHLLLAMGEACGAMPRDVINAVEGEVFHWGLRFLTEATSTSPIAHFITTRETLTLDALDREIMHIFHSSSASSLGSMASKLRVPPSTIKYRFDKLRVAGVISEEIYFINTPMKIFQGQIVIQLRVRTHDIESFILSTCSRHPYVECLIAGVGNWDYKVLLGAESLPDLLKVEEEITQALAKHVLKQSIYLRERVLSNRVGL